MRSLLTLYLVIGIVLLALGFLATGDCPEKNKDVVSNVVFVLGWPVYLYDDVVHGNLTAPAWLHKQAPVYGYRFDGGWFDIGNQQELLTADNLMRDRRGIPRRTEYLPT